MLSCEFCKIFNNTFLHRTLLVAAAASTDSAKFIILIFLGLAKALKLAQTF